jgi:protein SCO1/2
VIRAGLHDLLISGVMVLLLLLEIPPSGCSSDRREKSDSIERDSVPSFLVRGRVVSVSRARRVVIIAHDEIPGYMAAMTMPFNVKDTMLLGLAHPKDSVVGALNVSKTESWLNTLRVVKPAPIETGGIEWTEEFKREFFLKPGDLVPDFSLINEESKRVHLTDWRDKVVVITFIYTRCPLPDFCILMSHNFRKIQTALKADSTLDGRWQLLTVSFDPKVDTPKRLKEYGKTYEADFSVWSFATDSLETIGLLASRFQQAFWEDEGGLINHNLVTAVIDPRRRLYKVYTGNKWNPQDIVEDVRRVSHLRAFGD